MDILGALQQLLGIHSAQPAGKGVAQGAAAGGAAKALPPAQPIGYASPMAHINPQAMQGQVPVGQQMTPQHIASLPQNIQGLAQIYNQNPMDPRVAHIDPAQFGYAPDNTGAAHQGGLTYPVQQGNNLMQTLTQGYQNRV